MLVEDYLRPAAAKAGVLSSHRDEQGRSVEDDPRRFGFHNLRHSLASFLVRMKTDRKTVQTLLRHSNVKLTLQFYSHAVSQEACRALPRSAARCERVGRQPRARQYRIRGGEPQRASGRGPDALPWPSDAVGVLMHDFEPTLFRQPAQIKRLCLRILIEGGNSRIQYRSFHLHNLSPLHWVHDGENPRHIQQKIARRRGHPDLQRFPPLNALLGWRH